MMFNILLNTNNKTTVAILLTSLFFASLSYAGKTDNSRAPRYFSGHKFPDVGLLVPIPINPLWEHSLEPKGDNTTVLLTSPSMYYPSATLEFTLFKQFKVTEAELKDSALVALNSLRQKNNLQKKNSIDEFDYVEYGNIKGYIDVIGLKLGDKPFALKYLYGIMPSQQPVLLTVGTPQGQMEHIDHVVTKIWNKISVLPSALPDKSKI